HLRLGRGLEHVERAVDHDLLALSRQLLAPRPSEGGLVEHDVGAREVRAYRLAVADVDLHEARLPRRDRAGEVLGDAAHHGIERDDLARAARDRGVDDVRAHIPGAPRDHDARARDDAHFARTADRHRVTAIASRLAASLMPLSSVRIRHPRSSARARYSASYVFIHPRRSAISHARRPSRAWVRGRIGPDSMARRLSRAAREEISPRDAAS